MSDDEEVRVTLQLSIAGSRVEAEAYVPRGPTRPLRMLPVFQHMADALVDRVARSAELNGLTISCKAGCGACCRQLVPISETETHHLRAIVDAMSEPRRTEIRQRFQTALRRIAESGLLEKLENRERLTEDDLEPLGRTYFQLGIACPFLEDESCSIHPDRPISCREYLVTSPAVDCAAPSPETIRVLPLPGRVSAALARVDGSDSLRNTWWIPLPLALSHAESHPDAGPQRPGVEILGEVLKLLSGK